MTRRSPFHAKPRGAIMRAAIGYHGIDARSGCSFDFTVSGRGTFPDDMLRYDGVTSATKPPVVLTERGLREYDITGAGRCTPERWRSFGWSVHDNIIEKVADAGPDIEFESHGSIVLARPKTPAGEDWFAAQVATQQWFGDAHVIEPRYVEDIAFGAREAGLKVVLS